MTLKERVIVTAYTGVAMVCGKESSHFYAYAEELIGRPLMTYDFARDDICDALREKSKDDFIALCKAESVTNAARIRAMSDEELAEWLTPFALEAFTAGLIGLGTAMMEKEERLIWLQQPAEAEPHEQQ